MKPARLRAPNEVVAVKARSYDCVNFLASQQHRNPQFSIVMLIHHNEFRSRENAYDAHVKAANLTRRSLHNSSIEDGIMEQSRHAPCAPLLTLTDLTTGDWKNQTILA